MDNPTQGKPSAANHLLAIAFTLVCGVLWLAASVFLTDLLTNQPTTTSPTLLWARFNEYTLENIKFKQMFGVTGVLALLGCCSGLFAIYANSRSLHGTARFATKREIIKGGLFTKTGLIVGKYQNKYLVFGGQEFVLLAAPTRSGKGVSFVIPNLLNWQESMVVMDVKLENYLMTSGWRQKVLHQEVYLFNPFDVTGKTHRWNPLDSIRRDPVAMMADVQQIAHIFYPSLDGDKNRFFADSAQNLFSGLVLYLIETNHPCPTLGEVLRQGSGYGKPIAEHIQALIEACPDKQCRDPLSRFMSVSSPETVGNIKATFDAALQIFAQPAMDWATSASDFDLAAIRRKPMTIYLGIPVDMISTAARLQNLFFTQAINLNTRTLPEDDASLKYQAVLCMDEFAAMGRVPAIEKGAAYIAGFNLRLMTIFQSRSQIADSRLYGRESSHNLIANHGLKVLYTPTTQEEAKDYSDMLGAYTTRSTSSSSNRTSSNVFAVNTNVSSGSNTSDQRRMLMLPQELKQLNPDTCIIDRQGMPPVMAQKAYYYDDPIFLGRLAQVSPSLRTLLEGGKRSVSKEEITAIRVRGEFESVLTTAPFTPVFSSYKANPTEDGDSDDLLTAYLDTPDSSAEDQTGPNTVNTINDGGEQFDGARPNEPPTAKGIDMNDVSDLLTRFSSVSAATIAPKLTTHPERLSEAEFEAQAQALAARLMDYSAAGSVEQWLESVRKEFNAFAQTKAA